MSRSERTTVSLQILAEFLYKEKKVTFVTGAGISASCGIPTFRGRTDSKWATISQEKAKRSEMLKNPCKWYKNFWLQHFPDSILDKCPSVGHEVISLLSELNQNVFVVTQNIDGLHQKTKQSWKHSDHLAECHGRLGLYKCSSTQNEKESQCSHIHSETFTVEKFEVSNISGDILPRSMHCFMCGSVLAPLALLFDDYYDSHSFYKFETILNWFSTSDAIVFVGTSFSTTITSLAMLEASKRNIPVFNFNVSNSIHVSNLQWHFIAGEADLSLKKLLMLFRALVMKSDQQIESSDDKGYMLSLVLSHPLSQNQVTATLHRKFQRKYLDETLEEDIEQRWSEKVLQSPLIFNGLKFRLDHFQYQKEDKALSLQLGLTDYKSFLGTNWSPNSKKLLIDGILNFNDSKAYLSQKLGVSCILKSNDDKIVLIKRSQYVAEGKGKIDGPGGHPEPQNMLDQILRYCDIKSLARHNELPEQLIDIIHGKKKSATKQIDISLEPSIISTPSSSDEHFIGQCCVTEIFKSITDEIFEEINLPIDVLLPPLLLGIVEQRNSSYTPSAAFFVQCSLDSASIETVYRTNEGSNESSELLLVDSNRIRSEGFRNMLQELNLEPTCAIEGSVELWLKCLGA